MHSTTAETALSVLEGYRRALGALRDLPGDVDAFRALPEQQLLEINLLRAEAATVLDANGALVAGEIAHRSRPQLGKQGLAQRTGHRTPVQFLRNTTGAPRAHVITAIRVGELLGEVADNGRVDEATGEVCTPRLPWLRSVAAEVVAGRLSTSAADAIRSGLGLPNDAVTIRHLADAAARLVAESLAGVDVDSLWKRAREARDQLDLDGVALREEHLRATRDFRLVESTGGGGRAVWIMDPETFAHVKDLFDRATSPRRGGPRFVAAIQAQRATAIEADERTTGQLASDVMMHLLASGADSDASMLLGSGAPVIRITVAETSIETGVGLGRIEGSDEPVSLATVQRMLCEGTSMRLGFDADANLLDVEREQRLFSRRQREALSVKFGGCMHPGCDRPPSWCESHHIRQWSRDRGKTEVANGILLCKWHHLKYHNDGYEISVDRRGRYWLIPPASVDPARTPQRMALRSAAMRDLFGVVG
ncbi:MAG TPA: DUF222 domain-containing protein [Galbitalea sp.]